jgi:maltose alpha-D-glucosyltransferase / alpha-amylase
MTDDRLWYKDAIFYELRVRSFFDSDGDGIGDLKGLVHKLDYLQDLGVTTLWLLPFYPSPLRDDGYDIADYVNVHPDTGSLRDFKALLKEAHGRGLRVVTELVVNHTSDQHPWFQRARRAPAGSRFRNFYVWSDTPKRYADARIIFQDFETSNWSWDPVAQAYYWHRFYSHQPDLNYDNPEVQKAIFQVLDFWLELGVDGLRLDAVPYLYEREGTNCENLPETHAMLRKLRGHVDRKYKSRMLLAEANQWPEDAVSYFGSGDECHMAFHFPIMPRLFMALHMEDRFPILDILEQTPEIPESCQWAVFLRNHDELTLEMVTDEERDYMVSVYARERQARINLGIRRRLAPLLDNNRRRIELMNALLFSLPGTPVIYYGDEIGMGDNVYLGDRDGVRTPMQWSSDRNAGFSRVNPQRLILPVIVDPEYHFEAVNVDTQQQNPSSLLWWTKRVITLRKRHLAFGRGTLEPLSPSNRKILAFIRRYQDEVLLVVANLSRFSQFVELDLGEFKGSIPTELFGNVHFPRIGEAPYLLTLGPHNFFWFSLRAPRQEAGEVQADDRDLPVLDVDRSWEEALKPRGPLERLLARHLITRRWYRSKARALKAVHITDSIPLGVIGGSSRLLLLQVSYEEGDPETYVLPVRLMAALESRSNEPRGAALAVVRLKSRHGEAAGVLVDASGDSHVAGALLDVVIRRRRVRGAHVELSGAPGAALKAMKNGDEAWPTAHVLGAEQSNTSWVYGDRLICKLLRRVEDGESVELEILRYLSRQTEFSRVPTLAGHLKVDYGRSSAATLAIFQDFVPNQGDAWTYTVDEVQRYFERVVVHGQDLGVPPEAPESMFERAGRAVPAVAAEHIGGYLEVARQLGRRTAELHNALAHDASDPEFAPERVTSLSRRSFYQSLRNLASRVLDALREHIGLLPPTALEPARAVLACEREIRARLRSVLDKNLGGRRIRCHGDYHLGQVLRSGADVVIIDFEGEPARTLAERRRKRSPFADVAGMLRSFHYAVYGVLLSEVPGTHVRPEDVPLLERWAPVWYDWVSGAFLEEYLAASAVAHLLPESDEDRAALLDVHLMEKGLYELGYELNNRPEWVGIPLRGLYDLLGPAERDS